MAKDKIYETVQFTLEKLYIPLYTYIRFRTAQQLFMDLKEKQKFKLVGQNRRNEHLVQDGHFSVFKYKLLRNFLMNLQEVISKSFIVAVYIMILKHMVIYIMIIFTPLYMME